MYTYMYMYVVYTCVHAYICFLSIFLSWVAKTQLNPSFFLLALDQVGGAPNYPIHPSLSPR